MKNFFKKLSFVLAIAMVLTSIAPATASAAVSEKNVPVKKVNVKYDGEKVDSINLDVEETETIKLGLPVTKAAKAAGFTKTTFATAVKVADDSVVEVVKVSKRLYEITGVAAGETTITFGAAKTKKLAKAGEFKKEATLTVVVNEEATLTVEATGVRELTANLGTAANADAKVTVKRGTTTVSVAEVKAEGNNLIITTNGKMTAGTYTVTVDDLTAECAVEDEYVKDIIILDEDSYVGVNATADEVYVYYDVVNQYGESVRTAVTVQWTSSLTNGTDNKVDGYMIFKTAAGAAPLTYNSTIYVTGVYSKGSNVVTKQAEVKVGLVTKADAVEYAGIVKANTTAFTTLPVSFKANTYLLAFKVLDQYGHPYAPATGDVRDELSFTSKSPLLLTVEEKVGNEYPREVTIDGETYVTVWVQPGTHAKNGGSAEVNAISGGTGKVSVYDAVVAEDQILTNFKMSAPSDIVSEGRTVVIPFTAEDQNGEAITSYRVLLDSLTLSASKGTLFMMEQDDGSALLLYSAPGHGAGTDPETGAAYSATWTDDEIDDYVTLTSVVAKSGSFDSQNLYIKDRAYPAAISSVGGDKTLLEAGAVKIVHSYSTSDPYFTYVDQYGRDMVQTSTSTTIDREIADFFADHKIVAEYTGSDFTVNSTKTTTPVLGIDVVVEANPITGASVNVKNGTVTYKLAEDDGDIISGSFKKVNYTSVDLSKVVSFTVDTIGTVFGYNTNGVTNTTASWLDQQAGVSVKGTLADGTVVSVPYRYDDTTYYYDIDLKDINGYTGLVTQGAVSLSTGAAVTANLTVPTFAVDCTGVSGTYLFKDQYSAGNPWRDEKFKVVVTINDVNDSDADAQKDQVVEVVSVGKWAPTQSAFVGMAPATLVVNPSAGNIGLGDINYDGQLYWFVVDQYGKMNFADPTITFSKIVETEDNAGISSITVNDNASTTATISGAEIGDKFTVTLTLGNASISVDVTVGADSTAGFAEEEWSYRY